MFRLFAGIFLLLLSLLTVCKAPTNFFWRVQVAVTEFPWIFLLAAFLLFGSCFWAEKFRLTVFIISGITILLYTRPVFSAYSRAQGLEKNFSVIFPATPLQDGLTQPFSFAKMFTGIGIKQIMPVKMVYKKTAEKELALDFYSDSTTGNLPCVIVIHGGSWSEGDMKQLPALNSYLATRGYRVAAISYRLAPICKSPSPVEDTHDAMHFLIAHSAELKIDTNNFVLLGRSAGGQIALCSAYSFHDVKVKGVISFYAPADMVWGAKIKGNPMVLNTEKVFADYLGGSYEKCPEKYHEASACEYVNEKSPPTLQIHGALDALVSFHHAELLQEKLNACHVKNYFLDLPCATHGCDYNISGPSGQLTTYAVERFLASVIKN